MKICSGCADRSLQAHPHTLCSPVGGITVASSGSGGLLHNGDTRASYVLLDGPGVSIQQIECDIDAECFFLLRLLMLLCSFAAGGAHLRRNGNALQIRRSHLKLLVPTH